MEGGGKWLLVCPPDPWRHPCGNWRGSASPSGSKSNLKMSGKFSRRGHPYRDGHVLGALQLGLVQLLMQEQ